jgi:hypothetical protein
MSYPAMDPDPGMINPESGSDQNQKGCGIRIAVLAWSSHTVDNKLNMSDPAMYPEPG